MPEVRESFPDEETRPPGRASSSTPSLDSSSSSEQRFQLLAEANALLLSSADPEAVVQTVAERVMRLLGLDLSVNYVLDEESTRLRLNAQAGLSDEVDASIMRLDLGSAICGCVAKDGQRVVAEDIQRSDDSRADLVRSLGMHAYACHPPRAENRIMDTLSFGSRGATRLIDTARGHVRYVSPGHPPALVLGTDGEVRILEYSNPVLGAFPGSSFFEYQTFLASGDWLVLYSDGITEARSPNGRFPDESGLHRLLAENADVPARDLAGLLMEKVIAFTDGALRDDAAALVVALEEPDTGTSREPSLERNDV